jgi:hypothetical protein
MFGFGRLASYDYFKHIEDGLARRFRESGREARTYVLNVSPTASIRRRAATLNDLIAGTFEADGPAKVHLVGHSTGGLDARLVASPTARLPVRTRAWLGHLASVTTLNTPHYGTPLASFFATVSGQRVLYALSALTIVALTIGSPPLAAASSLVVLLARIDRSIGPELRVIDRVTESLLRVLDDVRGKEVRDYLQLIRQDQGAILQTAPEAMDLFQAGVEDRPGTLYQCVATMAPPPSASRYVKGALTRPWRALSSSIFAGLFALTSRSDERYPCCASESDPAHETMLSRTFGRTPGARANDGVVPIRSQLWGKLVWTGHADHLDVLGHFDGAHLTSVERHVDWLTSGSGFDHLHFQRMLDAIFGGMK